MISSRMACSFRVTTAWLEYVIECSILKVKCSEQLDFVVDESVQLLGGYGYSAEYPVERAYRDSRINRIFEGTNEINRMLIVGMLLKKAMSQKIDVMTPGMALKGEMKEGKYNNPPEDTSIFQILKKF